MDSAQESKQATLDLSGITAGATRAIVVPNKNGTLAFLSDITGSSDGSMATASILGRNAAGVGVPEVLTAATVRSILSLNNVENTALSTWAGSANLTTLGVLTGDVSFAVGKGIKSSTNFSALIPDDGSVGVKISQNTGGYLRFFGAASGAPVEHTRVGIAGGWDIGGTSNQPLGRLSTANGILTFVVRTTTPAVSGKSISYADGAAQASATAISGICENNWSQLTSGYAFWAQLWHTLNYQAFTNGYNYFAASPSVVANATINNAYGLYIEPQLVTGIGAGYGVYQAGTTDVNVFQGGVTLGSSLRLSAYGAGTLVTDASGNVTASSDERLKDIDGKFTRGLAALRGIQPILHHWNGRSELDQTEQYVGFSAQNVLRNIPEAVGLQLNGMYSLDLRSIVAALVNAVNELSAERSVDTLDHVALSSDRVAELRRNLAIRNKK